MFIDPSLLYSEEGGISMNAKISSYRKVTCIILF